MLEGIDYYPQKKKKKHNSKLWLIFLSVFGIASYLYFNLDKIKDTSVNNNSNLIVIIEDEKPEEVIVTKSTINTSDSLVSEDGNAVVNSKGLDEVIRVYSEGK